MTANSRQHRKIRQRIAASRQRARLGRPVSCPRWVRENRYARRKWTRGLIKIRWNGPGINWAKQVGNFPDGMGDTVWWLPPPEGGAK